MHGTGGNTYGRSEAIGNLMAAADVSQGMTTEPYLFRISMSSRRRRDNSDGTVVISPLKRTLESMMLKRAAVAFFYDEKGIVDDYFYFLLGSIRKFVDRIVFVSNGPLSKKSEIGVKPLVDKLLIRENLGFDVGAYLAGLEEIGFDKLGKYDEILLFNHTFYGPIFPFDEMFRTMDARECDFWGITAHKSMEHNPFGPKGELPYHLNSHFISIRRDLASSLAFRHYWKSLPPINSYEDSIVHHETRFTNHFMQLGYKHSVYVDPDAYGSYYPAFIDVDETLSNRCPILKRRLFYHNPVYHEENAIDLPRALAIIEEKSDYDPSLIWKNVVRTCRLRDLNAVAALMSIFPDVRLQSKDAPMDYGRIAVCAHVYYTDMLDELFSLTANIPVPYDFIATTETQAKKAEIERAAANRPGIRNVIVRVVEENCGRDMAALFVTCRDLFLEDHYDIVCRLHTKKSPQVMASRSNLFKRHMFENSAGEPGLCDQCARHVQGAAVDRGGGAADRAHQLSYPGSFVVYEQGPRR